jgi:hypothetical protein
MRKSQKCHLPRRLAQHAAGHLWIPIVESGKEHEENCSHQHVVEVGDNKVRTAELPVEGRDRKHDAGEACNEELEQESDGKTSSTYGEDGLLPPQMVASQLKILIPVGTEMTMVARVKNVFGAAPRPTVNMWWAHTLRLMKPMPTDAATIAG